MSVGCGSDEPADFTIHAPTATVQLTLGQQVDIDVRVERQGDLGGTIVVSAADLRAGITAGTARFPEGTDMAVLQLNVETSVTEGPIDGASLIGIVGDMERTTSIDLVVVAP